MKFSLSVDTSDLEKRLANAVSEVSADKENLETTIRDAVFEKAIEYLPARSVAEIRTRVERREFGWHRTSYTPKTAFNGRTKAGKKLYYYDNRYPDALWAQISRQRKASLLQEINKSQWTRRFWRRVGRNQIVGYSNNPRQAEAALLQAIQTVSTALDRSGIAKIDIRL